jgi:Tfp pilus assembly protein PilF
MKQVSMCSVLLAIFILSGCAGQRNRQSDQAKLYYDAGVGYINQGDPAKAVEHLKTANEYEGNNPQIMHALGLAFFQLGVPESALDWVQKAHNILPNDPEIHNNLASIFLILGQSEKAIFHSSKAISNPDYRTPAAAYYNRGVGKLRLGDMDGAEDDFNKAIRLEPLYDMPRVEIGRIMIRKNRFDEAIRHLTTAINNNPRNPESYLLRGEAYWRRGYVSRSESDFRKILELPNATPGMTDQAHDWLDRIR